MSVSFDGTKTVSVNGVTLAYREQGVGESVVLVHGASDLRIWERQEAAVGRVFRSIAYSRRYARPNADIEPGIDDQMLPHVEDLAALLNALKVAPAHLVGHSWGGFVALLTTIRHPNLVRSLVLVEPPVISLFVSTPPKPREILQLLVRRPSLAASIIKFGVTAVGPAQQAFRRGDDEAAVQALSTGLLGRDVFANISPARRQQLRDNKNVIRAQLLGAGFPPLTDNEVRSIDLPVLLVVGANSPPLFHQLSRRLHELLPRSELVTIANASHVVQNDNPTAFNEALLAFLESRRAA
jgi:pimeloyl-ACP methyl ester carboxylesterase